VALGAYVFVANGTANASTQWQLGAPTPSSITVDTTALTFNKLNATATFTADGTTINLSGNQFSALPNGILNTVTSTTNGMIYKTASVWAGIAPVNNALLGTNGSGVPSEMTTLPTGLTIPGFTLSGTLTATGQSVTGGTFGSSTLTTPTINGGALSGTFSGAHTYSGVPIFSGLSSGTQTVCLGLDSGNHLVYNTGACGTGNLDTVTTGIAAAGTTQGTATSFSTQQNYVATGANCTPDVSGSCAAGSAAVIANASLMVAGQHFNITNKDTSFGILFYPPSGDTINGQSANTPITIAPKTTARFNVESSSALWSVP
jgi:hypothetical protein